MISQHWLRWWLSTIRQQAITWDNVDSDLCHHIVSSDHNHIWRHRILVTLGKVLTCHLIIAKPLSEQILTNDTLPWLWLLLIVTLQSCLCDCYVSRGLYCSMQTETVLTLTHQGKGFGALQGHLYEGCCLKQEYFTHGSIGWIYIPWWWLATEHGLSSGLLLNRRYCNGFWLVKPVVLERFYHANWPL